MFNYIWPLALVVISNVAYQVCAKMVPERIHPLASLTITYAVGAVVSLILYYVLHKDANILSEYAKTNWTPVILGFSVVGLEVGYIYAYKAGWEVSTASLVQGAVLAIALLFIGILAFHESFSMNKCLGIVICMVGLFFLNR